MGQLQHPLEFVHKFNLFKLSGLLIEDDDLQSIARVYGVALEELEKVEESFQRNIDEIAADLPQKSNTPEDTSVSILAIGDSITSDRESYVKILNRHWREDPTRRILDSAVSGYTTADLIKRFYSTVLNRDFQWAVLFIGTNDGLQLDEEIRIPVLSLDEYKRNIRFITEALIDNGKSLIQVTIPPVDTARLQSYFAEDNYLYTAKHIGQINDFIRDWAKAKGYPVADLARAVREQNAEFLEPDGLHLNGRGQLILSKLLLEILP